MVALPVFFLVAKLLQLTAKLGLMSFAVFWTVLRFFALPKKPAKRLRFFTFVWVLCIDSYWKICCFGVFLCVMRNYMIVTSVKNPTKTFFEPLHQLWF